MSIHISARFNGPPTSGNGGYACGLLAQHIDGAAEVTLRKPPPLEKALTLQAAEGNRLLLCDGGELIAEARPSALDMEVPAPPSLAAAKAAVARYAGFKDHIFPNCFVCGPQRAKGDGLHIFPGSLPGGPPRVAAPWTPEAALSGEDGYVPSEFLWAALDCPGYFALYGTDKPLAVLGRITAEIHAPLQADVETIVTGWPIARDGRKGHCGTAIYDTDGFLYARARSTWIEIDSVPS